MHTFLLLAALTGCFGPAEGPARDKPDVLVVAVPTTPATLHPALAAGSFTQELVQQMFLPLLRADLGDEGWSYAPGIASSWSWSEDHTVLTLQLRDDLTWSDGKPITARDVAFTFDLIADPETASPLASNLGRMVSDKRPEVLSEHSVAFHFTVAYPPDTMMGHVLTPLVVPAHVYEDADRRHLKGRDDNLDPVVSGPWKAGKYVPNEQLSLVPNPNFSGPDEDRAQLDRVIFRVLPEAATRVQALRSGEVDLVGRLTVDDLGILDDTQARIVRRGWRNIDTIAWNHTDPRFASSDVRRALSMALDVDKMIGGVMTAADGTAYARRATGIFPPALGLELPDVTPLPHDPDGARALLAAAGWTDSDGDGLLDKDGEPFSFELLVAVGHKHRKDVAIYVQRDLREVGVDVRIQQLEGRTYGQHVLGRTYEAAMVGWTAGLHPDPTGLLRSDPEDGVRETNYVGYRNPEVDALIEEALAQLDPAEAAQRWSRLMGMVYADQPYTFLWWRDELTGIDPQFTDIGSNLQGTFRDLARWRIDHDR